jgi:hypothetical protein
VTRCKLCKYGINDIDAGSNVPFVICTLIPPTPVVVEEKLTWVRPSMAAHGWCGQAKFSIRKFFFRGPRA